MKPLRTYTYQLGKSEFREKESNTVQVIARSQEEAHQRILVAIFPRAAEFVRSSKYVDRSDARITDTPTSYYERKTAKVL